MKLLILIAIIGVAVVAWQMRTTILAKVLGQSESRVNRRLNRKR